MEETPQNTGFNGSIATRFKPGNPGKIAGTATKLTRTVKETVLTVFQELQGDPKHSLKAFAKRYPRDFYTIASKLIPTEISGKLVTTINVIETTAAQCVPLDTNAN